MEDLVDPEEKIICPYNNSHHIRRCKMSFHLVKCKKNYSDLKMVACDFNATHLIPEPELQYHHTNCPDRKKLEPNIASESRANVRFPIPNLSVPSDENWDDLDCPTYNPSAYAESSNVLRHMDVASGAARKHFRMAERQRLNNLSASTSGVRPLGESNAVVSLPPHASVTKVDQKPEQMSLSDIIKKGKNKVYKS